MAFGARVLKSGVAVTLALYVSMLLQLTPPVIAAVAAIFAVQPSIYRSWRYFLEQLQTNVIGAVIALLAGRFFSNEPVAVGVVCILVIMICIRMKMEETIGLTLVTVIAVMEASGQLNFALNRFILTSIGIAAAFLVNILLFPPKPKEQFISQIHRVFSNLSLLLRTVISDEIKETVYREEKQSLEGALKGLSDKYKLFEEEQKKFKRAKYSRSRHLVVYKQMLYTLHKGYEVLDAVEEHYFGAGRTEESDVQFDQHLERLIKYHEHVMLKFDDKLKPNSSEIEEMEALNEAFLESVLKLYGPEREGALRMTIVASMMYDYGFQTGRLDRMIEQFNRGVEVKEPWEFSLRSIRKNLGERS